MGIPTSEGSQRRFLKHFWQVSFFQVLNSASTFMINILVARWIGPERFGDFFFYISTSVVATILFDFGLTRTLLRYSAFSQARGNVAEKLKYYSVVLRLKLFAGVMALVLGIGISLFFFKTLGVYLSLGLATGFIISFCQYLSAVAQTEEDYTAYNLVLSFNTLRFVLIGGAFMLGVLSMQSLFVVFLAAPALLALVPAWKLSRDMGKAGEPPEQHFYGNIIRFGRWLILLSLLETLYQRLDVLLVRGLTDATQAGYYGGALAFFGIVYLLPTFSAVLVYPKLVAAQSRKDDLAFRQYYRFSTDLMGVLTIPMAIGLWAIAPGLVGMFLGAKFSASLPLFKYFALYSLILGIHLNSGAVFFAKDQPYLPVIVVASALLTNAAGVLTLVPRYGIEGAAFALCAAVTVSLLVSWGLIHGRYRLLPNFGHLFCYFILSLAMGIIIRHIRVTHWSGLVLQLGAGVLIYLGALALLHFKVWPGLVPLGQESLSAKEGAA